MIRRVQRTGERDAEDDRCDICRRDLDRMAWLLVADHEGHTTAVYCWWCAERRGLWRRRERRAALRRVG